MRKILSILIMTFLITPLMGCEAKEPAINIENHEVSKDTITFDLDLEDPDNTLERMDIILQDSSSEEVTRLEETDLDGIEKFEESTFSNLAESEDYTIVVKSDYTLNGDTHEAVSMDTLEFSTKDYLDIGATIENAEVEDNTIEFDLTINDPEEAITALETQLVDSNGDTVTTLDEEDGIGVGENEAVTFENMYYETDYTIEVLATYQDGHRTREDKVINTHDFTTESATAPTSSLLNEEARGHTYLFDLEINDPSGILENIDIILYDDSETEVERIESSEETLETGLNKDLTFERLNYDTDYTVEVVADYYPDDTLEEAAVLDSATFTTDQFVEPSGNLKNIVWDDSSVTFDATLSDESYTVTYPAVLIYESSEDTPLIVFTAEDGLQRGENQEISFTGLSSGVEYELVFMADYYDGDDESTIIFDSTTFTTD